MAIVGSLDPETQHGDDTAMSHGHDAAMWHDAEPAMSQDADPAMSDDADPAMSDDADPAPSWWEHEPETDATNIYNAEIRLEHGDFEARPERRLPSKKPLPDARGAVKDRSYAQSSDWSETSAVPVTIYLSDGQEHGKVESAVEHLLADASLMIVSRDDPVMGSWFLRMRASRSSPYIREAALIGTHIADTRLVLAEDAKVTATLMQGVGPVLASLRYTKDAVVRLGAVLIVKVDWAVTVNQLTAAQQAILDHQPELVSAPRDILAALNLPADGTADGRAPLAVED